GPELGIALQPHLMLLELKYPVDDLRIAVNEKLEEHDSASNAVAEGEQHRTVRPYRRLKPQPIYLAVHRAEDFVWYRRLDADEYRLLDALRQGLPIGEALEKAMQGSAIAEERLEAAVQ